MGGKLLVLVAALSRLWLGPPRRGLERDMMPYQLAAARLPRESCFSLLCKDSD